MHRHRGHGFRDARPQRNDARDVGRLRGLAHTSKNHFIHKLGIQSRAGQQGIHGDAPEFIRAERRQIGARLAERRAHTVHDDEPFAHEATFPAASAVPLFGAEAPVAAGR